MCIVPRCLINNRIALFIFQSRGGGYEKQEAYTSSELIFCDIHNIHVMRESLRKLQDVCLSASTDDKHWLSNLEQTQWLHHIKVSNQNL